LKLARAVLLVGLVSALSSAASAQPAGHEIGELRILGFTDMKLDAVDGGDILETTSGFHMGQLILHLMRPMSERWGFFAETATTAKSDGSFGVSFERVIARYRFSEFFKLSMGRYHTPVNWWNESFHHGQWLQTTADRPEMTRFGGKFVPVHFVGIMEEGSATVASLSTTWTAGIGNGRQANIAGAGEGGDDDTHRAWLVGLDIRPDALYKLEIGGAVYQDAVPPAVQDTVTIRGGADELLVAGHLVWHGETPEFIAEYARIHHDAITGSTDGDSEAWYAQLGWRLAAAEERLKPYVRYERLEIDAKDPVYGAGGSGNATRESDRIADSRILTAGVRIDLATLVALKLEYQGRKVANSDWYKTYVAQLALSF